MTTKETIERMLREGYDLGHLAIPSGTMWLFTALTTIAEAARKEGAEATSKAYGGCQVCYGKGYSTHIDRVSGRGESDIGNGDVIVDQVTPYYLPCKKCDRGAQIERMMSYIIGKHNARILNHFQEQGTPEMPIIAYDERVCLIPAINKAMEETLASIKNTNSDIA